jgi:molecular chaperone GrpE (heat shock protein)
MSENQKSEENGADKAATNSNADNHTARDLAAQDLAARAKAAGVPDDASPEEIEAALAANESEAVDELTVAQAEVATLKAKIADLQDQYVRGQAEVQNARRRAEEDVSKARKFGVESFAESLLSKSAKAPKPRCAS